MNKKIYPIVLFMILLILDQVSKALIIKMVNPGDTIQLIGSIYITNIRNINTSYSSNLIRIFVQIIIPIIIIILLGKALIAKNYFTQVQKVAMWTLASGGVGNIIDRTFRPSGVLDFIYIKNIYFIPVFNIADLSVAIGSTIMVVSLILQDRRLR